MSYDNNAAVMNVASDIIANASGSAGQRLLTNGMSVHSIRPWIGKDGRTYMNRKGPDGKLQAVPVIGNATLRKDEWKAFDDEVLELKRNRLTGISDLEMRGLVLTLNNGLGKMILEYEDESDISEAEMNMDGATKSKKDRPDYLLKGLPLPLISKDFSFNIRQLMASRERGEPLDTRTAFLAGKKVMEYSENLLFNGSTLKFGGYNIYGYTTQPSRNTVTLSEAWDASAKTGQEMVDDVLAMLLAANNAKYYGPFVIYIPKAYSNPVNNDYKAASDKTIRQRILEIDAIADIKVSDYLADDTIIMVQMTKDVVRLVRGLPMTPVEWSAEGGMIANYKIMTIEVPQLRADQDSNCGIVHLS